MTLHTAIRKIDALSQAELKHAIQLSDIEIANYQVASRNYPRARMERFGTPYLKRLQDRRSRFENKLRLLQQADKLLPKNHESTLSS